MPLLDAGAAFGPGETTVPVMAAGGAATVLSPAPSGGAVTASTAGDSGAPAATVPDLTTGVWLATTGGTPIPIVGTAAADGSTTELSLESFGPFESFGAFSALSDPTAFASPATTAVKSDVDTVTAPGAVPVCVSAAFAIVAAVSFAVSPAAAGTGAAGAVDGAPAPADCWASAVLAPQDANIAEKGSPAAPALGMPDFPEASARWLGATGMADNALGTAVESFAKTLSADLQRAGQPVAEKTIFISMA